MTSTKTIRQDIDIIQVSKFLESCKVFIGVIMELRDQEIGGEIEHHPINDADLVKLYDYLTSSDNVWRSFL